MSHAKATCTVERGLHALHYVDGGQAEPKCSAFVRIPAAATDFVRIISAPGRKHGELKSPGSSLVVRAEKKVTLDIILDRPREDSDVNARFELETLDGGVFAGIDGDRPMLAPLAGQIAGGAEESVAPEITLLAHVSRLGDVRLQAGQWIAGPEKPLPLEGIEFRCPGDRVGVETQIRTVKSGEAWSEWIPSGSFAGSRQRALALTGIRLRLVGPDADRFAMSCDVLFLATPLMSKIGRELEFTGTSSLDPIVGLRVAITTHFGGSSRPSDGSIPSKVRTFRASDKALEFK